LGILLKMFQSKNVMSKELLAPNGKPSRLNAIQYKLVRTPAFKKWFGDWENDPDNASKVVDENGEPLLCYRGQKNKRTQDEKRKSNTYGIYYSANKDSVSIYGNLITISFINLKNPIILKDTKWNLSLIPRYVYESLIKKGYDGAIWDRKNEFYEIVAFQPNQIKLADGTNTTFDSKNNDIRYNKGGITKSDTPDYLKFLIG